MTRPLFPFFIDSPWISAAGVAGLALVACALILAMLLKTGLAWRLATDIPNDRSLHTRPTPRIGGWGIVPVSVIAMLVAAPPLWLAAAGTAFLAAVSQIDDRRGLPARVRFGAHLLAVAALIALNPAPVPWWALAACRFPDVVAGQPLQLHGRLRRPRGRYGALRLRRLRGRGALRPHAADRPRHRERGDRGRGGGVPAVQFPSGADFSRRLGLDSARAFSRAHWDIGAGCKGTWPVWFPALVFAPFIADASVTLLRRLARGERFWQAHREHYYQRMVQLGMGHGRTACAWYLLMLAGIMLAVRALGFSSLGQWCAVAGWAIVVTAAGAVVDVYWRRHQSRLSEQP